MRPLNLDDILDAVLDVGLDRFSVARVARELDVTDMALYRYVRSRDELYARAAARAYERCPLPTGTTTDWHEHLVEVAEHEWRVARTWPGIERYVLDGPYYASTLDRFDTGIARLTALAPALSREECYLLLSRVTSLAHAAANNALAGRYQDGPDRPGELFLWTVRALVRGMTGLLEAGELPRNRAALTLGPESRIPGDDRVSRPSP